MIFFLYIFFNHWVAWLQFYRWISTTIPSLFFFCFQDWVGVLCDPGTFEGPVLRALITPVHSSKPSVAVLSIRGPAETRALAGEATVSLSTETHTSSSFKIDINKTLGLTHINKIFNIRDLLTVHTCDSHFSQYIS